MYLSKNKKNLSLEVSVSPYSLTAKENYYNFLQLTLTLLKR